MIKTWKIDIVGGANDSAWHGTVEAPDGYSAKIAGRQAAHEEGFVFARHTEVYVTHQS